MLGFCSCVIVVYSFFFVFDTITLRDGYDFVVWRLCFGLVMYFVFEFL